MLESNFWSRRKWQPRTELSVGLRVFAADIAGYSRLIGIDELGTLRDLTAYREIMDGLVSHHGGRIADTAGDSVLAEFPSVVNAVECAVAVQMKLRELILDVAPDKALRFRIGIHLGDVIIRGEDLLGDGVNVAARLKASLSPAAFAFRVQFTTK